MSTPCDFVIVPAKRAGFSRIQWDYYNGTPRRSVTVETDIAEVWVDCHALKDAVMLNALNRVTYMTRVRSIATKFTTNSNDFNALVDEMSELL
jgi:hypothetical protein